MKTTFNTCSRSLVCKLGGALHVEPKKALRSISIFVVVATVAASVSATLLPSLSLVYSFT